MIKYVLFSISDVDCSDIFFLIYSYIERGINKVTAIGGFLKQSNSNVLYENT